MQANNGVRYQTGQPSNSHYWAGYAYGALPTVFPTTNSGSNNNRYVMRATVTIK